MCAVCGKKQKERGRSYEDKYLSEGVMGKEKKTFLDPAIQFVFYERETRLRV